MQRRRNQELRAGSGREAGVWKLAEWVARHVVKHIVLWNWRYWSGLGCTCDTQQRDPVSAACHLPDVGPVVYCSPLFAPEGCTQFALSTRLAGAIFIHGSDLQGSTTRQAGSGTSLVGKQGNKGFSIQGTVAQGSLTSVYIINSIMRVCRPQLSPSFP